MADEVAKYRRVHGSDVWHWCRNCQDWPPDATYEYRFGIPPEGKLCQNCADLDKQLKCGGSWNATEPREG